MNINQFARQWKRWRVAVLVFGLIASFSALYVISDGHIKEYFIWRWMVIFKQPVTPVTDF